MAENIGIVGAGVGGLATAVRLARRGYKVRVFEKLPRCGGRNNIIEDAGFKFDTGPSFVLMPDFFSEIFSDCQEDIRAHLNLVALDTSYKIFYPDDTGLTVYNDSRRTKQELERIEKGSSRAFDGFIRETARIYAAVRPLLYKCFTSRALFNPRYLGLITKLRPFESYWQLARRFFKSEKLCYAFTFEAMFMGVSPFDAPAFYSVISYADHVQKIFHPEGGMYRIPLALEALAKRMGVIFNYDSEVESIKQRGAKLILKTGLGEAEFGQVVVNADYAYAQKRLLRRNLPDYKYSCSVYLIYLGLKKKLNGLAHHNLFFAKDLRGNLRDIFKDGSVTQDFSFYVHVPTVTDSSLAPGGKDIAYILIPVPNLKVARRNFSEEEGKLRAGVFSAINEKLGIRIQDLIEVEHRFYPGDFTARYNIEFGATFGLAHNLMQSAFFRPANFDPRIKGLHYVGASTQPGGGLPVVIAGSRIVADKITS